MKKIKKLFEGLPKKLSEEEYNAVINTLEKELNNEVIDTKQIEKIDIFKNSYIPDQNYTLNIDEQNEKQRAMKLREILEHANLPNVFTPKKLYNLFKKLTVNSNEKFSEFLYGKINEGDER